MEQHPLANKRQLALNVEASGSSGKSVLFETGEDSGWLVKHYAQTAKAPLSSSLFYEVYKFLPNDTDLTIFKDHGLSIESFIQRLNQEDKTADLIIITHEANNLVLNKALQSIIKLDGVIKEPVCLSIYS